MRLPWSITRLLIALIIYHIINIFLGGVIAYIVIHASIGYGWNIEPEEIILLAETYLFLISSIATFLVFRWLCIRNNLSLSALWGDKLIPMHHLVIAVALGIAFNIPWAVLGEVEITTKYTSTLMLITVIISIGFLGPLVEELFFRGLFYRTLRARYTIISATAISSLLFTLAHIDYLFDPINLTFVFIHGVVTALLFERTGSLTASFVFHSIINLASVIQRSL